MGDILSLWPMPAYRPKQREVLLKIHELFESGKRLILLEAPTGFGKSAVNTALCRYYTPSIYTTPQISLINQIAGDPYLGKYFVEIKGMDNYRCAKDNYLTPVRLGLCRRERNVIPDRCNWLRECPYFSQKIKAIKSPMVLTSTAYFIVDAYLEPPNFSNRNLVVIDEGHLLSEYVADQVSLEVSSRSLPDPMWSRLRDRYRDRPPTDAELEDIRLELEVMLKSYQMALDSGAALTDDEAEWRHRAERWLDKYRRYLDFYDVAEWVWTRMRNGWKAVPVYARWFMEQMLWSRGQRFLVSSATILKPKLWIWENGADLVFRNDEMVFLEVSYSFPAENRPIVDMSVGSMSKADQHETLEPAAMMLKYIIQRHRGENIAVHFPSYELAEKFRNLIGDDVDAEILLPSPENRDTVLEEWKRRGGVFFAVAYWEGQDWKYDICTVQVLAKTLYPDVSDPRIMRRLEKKDFQWLMWITLIKCLQAYGRAMRAEDDRMVFYVLDDKFWELLRRNWPHIPEWFKQVVPRNRWPKKYQKKQKENGGN